MFRKWSSCVKHAILFTRNPIEEDEDGSPCFICKDVSTYNNELLRCRGDVRCSARCHKSCVAEAMKVTNKKLNCPCGSDYGSYVGRRLSLSLTSYIYAIIGGLLGIEWNSYSLYPRTTVTLTITLYSIIHYNISKSLAWILLGYPILILISWTFILFSMRNVAVKSQAKNIFEWWRGPRSNWSSLEIFIDTIMHNRLHDDDVDAPLLNVYNDILNSFSDDIYNIPDHQTHNIITLSSLLRTLIEQSLLNITISHNNRYNSVVMEELQNIDRRRVLNIPTVDITPILTNRNVIAIHDTIRTSAVDLNYLRNIDTGDSDSSVEELQIPIMTRHHSIIRLRDNVYPTSLGMAAVDSFQNNEVIIVNDITTENSSQTIDHSIRHEYVSVNDSVMMYSEESSRESSNILGTISE